MAKFGHVYGGGDAIFVHEQLLSKTSTRQKTHPPNTTRTPDIITPLKKNDSPPHDNQEKV